MLADRLGQLLLRERIISASDLESCLAEHKKSKVSLVELILTRKVVDERMLVEFLAKQYKLTVVDLHAFEFKPELKELLPATLCQKYSFVPVGKRGDTLVIAVSDPTNIQALDDIRFQTRTRVEQVLTQPSVIAEILKKHFGAAPLGNAPSEEKSEGTRIQVPVPTDMTKFLSDITKAHDEANGGIVDDPLEDEIDSVGADDAPIIQFVTAILIDAIRKGASDIHIEPYEADLRVRIRIDGDLQDSVKPPIQVRRALVARIKVMAKLRLDEKRLPQDGRVRMRLPEGGIVDFRVNILPTVHGEKAVLRILDRRNAVVSFEDIGFEKDDLEKYKKGISNPWGMVLVAGATGSGKTTTLYASINSLNTTDVNISTIEDPVEYNFTGINQVQTKEQIGLTFAETLRALLRQDPDIVLLGEIRDAETAGIALKAALTGHLVLSTLHTNDAPSAVMRLKDMGVDPFLINSALLVVLSQRLVRKICPDCKEVDTRHSADSLAQLGFPSNVIGKFQPMRGKGCKTCNGKGTKGRVAIHECMVMSDAIKEVVGRGGSTEDIRKMAIKEGMKTLKVSCMRKVMKGLVSVDEIQFAV